MTRATASDLMRSLKREISSELLHLLLFYFKLVHTDRRLVCVVNTIHIEIYFIPSQIMQRLPRKPIVIIKYLDPRPDKMIINIDDKVC